MEKKKTSLGPPASASPGQKGICHLESCGRTFSDKGLSQGQGQPAERKVEPESTVPGQAEMSLPRGLEQGCRDQVSMPVLLSASGSATIHSQAWVLSLAPSLQDSTSVPPLASGLPALPLPQPVCLYPWPSVCLPLAIFHRHGPQVFLKLSVHPQS